MTVTIRNPDGDAFRDIRDDLRTRVKKLEAMLEATQAKFVAAQEKALAEHKRETDAFKAAIAGYRRMLDLEETFAKNDVLDPQNKIGPRPEGVKIAVPQLQLPLADFICAELSERPSTNKEGLREAAEQAGYFTAGGGGRAIHATVINLLRTKRISVDINGKYSVVKRENVFL